MYGGGSRRGQIQVVQKGVEIVIGDYITRSYSALYQMYLISSSAQKMKSCLSDFLGVET